MRACLPARLPACVRPPISEAVRLARLRQAAPCGGEAPRGGKQTKEREGGVARTGGLKRWYSTYM